MPSDSKITSQPQDPIDPVNSDRLPKGREKGVGEGKKRKINDCDATPSHACVLAKRPCQRKLASSGNTPSTASVSVYKLSQPARTTSTDLWSAFVEALFSRCGFTLEDIDDYDATEFSDVLAVAMPHLAAVDHRGLVAKFCAGQPKRRVCPLCALQLLDPDLASHFAYAHPDFGFELTNGKSHSGDEHGEELLVHRFVRIFVHRTPDLGVGIRVPEKGLRSLALATVAKELRLDEKEREALVLHSDDGANVTESKALLADDHYFLRTQDAIKFSDAHSAVLQLEEGNLPITALTCIQDGRDVTVWRGRINGRLYCIKQAKNWDAGVLLVVNEGCQLISLQEKGVSGISRFQWRGRMGKYSATVVEWVEGRTLWEECSGGKQPVAAARVQRWYAQLENILQQVHDAGLDHGDVTPPNIIVSAADDSVTLIGFGVARNRGLPPLATCHSMWRPAEESEVGDSQMLHWSLSFALLGGTEYNRRRSRQILPCDRIADRDEAVL